MADNTLSCQVMLLEQQNQKWQKEREELEKIILKKNEQIEKISLLLKLERFKTSLFAQIIKDNTDIKLSDVIQEYDDGILIRNINSEGLPIYLEGYNLKDIEKDGKQVKQCVLKPKKTGKISYRAINTEIEEEKPAEQEAKIKKIDDNFDMKAQQYNLDISISETNNSLNTAFESLKKNHNYKNLLITIKELRTKLLAKYNIVDYTKILETHLIKLKSIFKQKKYEEKKISSALQQCFTSLDKRLISFEKYYDSVIEPNELEIVKISMELNSTHSKRYIPFNISDIHNKINNYTLALFSIKKILKNVLVNPYGFSNVVYLSLSDTKKITSEHSSMSEDNNENNENKEIKEIDPFRFYVLEKIDSNGQRFWKLECRLYDLSYAIAQNIKMYCIGMFRKIYFDIFKDNTYREDYKEKSIITREDQDCEQLLHNIITVSRRKMFCDTLRQIIMKKSIINPTNLDRFNLKTDDKSNKKEFSKEDSVFELNDVIKQLFDNINQENIDKIIFSLNK